MDEYKDLIDLALKTNDKEWFNHLTEQAKQYEKTKSIHNIQNQPTNKPNITLEEFNNDGIALQTNDGLRNPISYEDLEKYKFVKIKSKRNGALKIYKGEDVSVESLIEEQSYYKAYWYGFFQGYTFYYSNISEKESIIKSQDSVIEKYKEMNDILKNMSKEKDKQIELLKNKIELLKVVNSQNNIKLWSKLKAVFKKQWN